MVVGTGFGAAGSERWMQLQLHWHWAAAAVAAVVVDVPKDLMELVAEHGKEEPLEDMAQQSEAYSAGCVYIDAVHTAGTDADHTVGTAENCSLLRVANSDLRSWRKKKNCTTRRWTDHTFHRRGLTLYELHGAPKQGERQERRRIVAVAVAVAGDTAADKTRHLPRSVLPDRSEQAAHMHTVEYSEPAAVAVAVAVAGTGTVEVAEREAAVKVLGSMGDNAVVVALVEQQ